MNIKKMDGNSTNSKYKKKKKQSKQKNKSFQKKPGQQGQQNKKSFQKKNQANQIKQKEIVPKIPRESIGDIISKTEKEFVTILNISEIEDKNKDFYQDKKIFDPIEFFVKFYEDKFKEDIGELNDNFFYKNEFYKNFYYISDEKEKIDVLTKTSNFLDMIRKQNETKAAISTDFYQLKPDYKLELKVNGDVENIKFSTGFSDTGNSSSIKELMYMLYKVFVNFSFYAKLDFYGNRSQLEVKTLSMTNINDDNFVNEMHSKILKNIDSLKLVGHDLSVSKSDILHELDKNENFTVDVLRAKLFIDYADLVIYGQIKENNYEDKSNSSKVQGISKIEKEIEKYLNMNILNKNTSEKFYSKKQNYYEFYLPHVVLLYNLLDIQNLDNIYFDETKEDENNNRYLTFSSSLVYFSFAILYRYIHSNLIFDLQNTNHTEYLVEEIKIKNKYIKFDTDSNSKELKKKMLDVKYYIDLTDNFKKFVIELFELVLDASSKKVQGNFVNKFNIYMEFIFSYEKLNNFLETDSKVKKAPGSYLHAIFGNEMKYVGPKISKTEKSESDDYLTINDKDHKKQVTYDDFLKKISITNFTNLQEFSDLLDDNLYLNGMINKTKEIITRNIETTFHIYSLNDLSKFKEIMILSRGLTVEFIRKTEIQTTKKDMITDNTYEKYKLLSDFIAQLSNPTSEDVEVMINLGSKKIYLVVDDNDVIVINNDNFYKNDENDFSEIITNISKILKFMESQKMLNYNDNLYLSYFYERKDKKIKFMKNNTEQINKNFIYFLVNKKINFYTYIESK